MALSLYQEAIAEAKQLRDVAEQNAKNKIIDAVTPKIRRLIERQLLGEDHEPGHEEDEELAGDDLAFLSDEEGDAGAEAPPTADHEEPDGDELMTIDLDDLGGLSPEETLGAGMSIGAEPEVQADLAGDTAGGPSINVPAGADVDLEIGADGSVSVDTGVVDLHVGEGEGGDLGMPEDELLLDEPVAEALSRLLQYRKGQAKATLQLEKKLNRFQRKLRRFYVLVEALRGKQLSSSQRAIVRKHYTKLLREIGSLRRAAILTERESGDNRLNRRTVSILKEMKKMSRTSRRRNTRGSKNYLARLLETQVENDLAEFDLFEEEEDEAAAEEGGEDLELEDEELEGDVDSDAVQGAVEDLLAALPVDLEVVAAEEGEEGEEDLGAEEGGEEELEFEGDLYAGHFREGDKDDDDEEVVEIDETMLRRELKRLQSQRSRGRGRRIREETAGVDDASQTADAFGGGDVEDEMFVDVDADTLLNALADELGDAPMPTQSSGGGTDAMPEGRRRARSRARAARSNKRTNESRQNRALRGKLGQYQKAVGSLRGQLTEMNLFNAKLLYANKLMQNRNLSPRQQRAIVEALDGAKTLREAKLLYKSLTGSLAKSNGGKSSRLSEGASRRTAGSASRSTQSARPANSGVEVVDRWAVLAGIGENTK